MFANDEVEFDISLFACCPGLDVAANKLSPAISILTQSHQLFHVRIVSIVSASLPFLERVPCESTPCSSGCRLEERMTDPSQSSIEDLFASTALRSSLLNSANPRNPSQTGIDERLNSLIGGYNGSPRLGSIQQERLDDGVEYPDLNVCCQIGWLDVLQLTKSRSRLANSYMSFR